MTLNEILPHLIYSFKSESELINSIRKLSDNFTIKREKIDTYLKDEKLVSAYTAFYLTTNYPKWNEVLRRIGLAQDELDDYEIIDIGTGPGTLMLAALENNPSQMVYGYETSELMSIQGNKLIEYFYKDSQARIYNRLNSLPLKKKKRLGIFGHSANEMEVGEVIKIIEKLEFDNVLFIEPGTKSYFEKSLIIRDKLLGSNFSISYPCPSSTKCPMTDKDDWCHQFLYIKQSPDVERICQILKKDRKLLPQTIHYFEKEPKISEHVIKRVIRLYKPTKFGLEFQICESQDGENRNFDLQQLGRHKSKQEMKKLQAILAGDEIKFEVIKDLGKNHFRGEVQIPL